MVEKSPESKKPDREGKPSKDRTEAQKALGRTAINNSGTKK